MQTELNKFVRSVLVFIPVTGLIYCLLVCVWGDFASERWKKNLHYQLGSAGHIYSRLKEVKTKRNIDVLFLGSSHTYRGFDTRIFGKAGFNSFNLGSSSQSPLQTEVLVKRYLDRLHPKMVIYEVYPVTFSGDGTEASLDLISNDNNDWRSIQLAIRQRNIKVANTLIYSFYQQLIGKNHVYQPYRIEEDTYIPGGFVERKFHRFKHVPLPKQKWDFNPGQFHALERTVAFIKSRKIPVVFVLAPMTKAVYNSYTNTGYFHRKMRGYGTYFDFNQLMQLDDSLHFYDADHMNQEGVKLFDEQVIERVLD